MPVQLAVSAAETHTYQLLVHHILEGAVLAAPEQEIVYRDRHRQTYRQLRDRVNRLASALTSLGVSEGDTVAMMDWDSHRYLETYFAVPMMGAVLQTVNFRLSAEQLIYCVRSSNASVLIFHRDFAAVVDAIRPHLPELRQFILIADHNDLASGPTEIEYETLLTSGSPQFSFPVFDENAVATTFHTTGTTGNPKAVSFSHRQLVLHTLAVTAALASQPDGQALRRDDVYMPLTPMFHVHAWGIPYIATMLGIKQVYPGRYEPEMLLGLRQSEKVSFSHCVPTVLQMILSAAESKGIVGLGPWTMLIGGSALPRSLQSAAESSCLSALAGYGMSESGPAIAIARYVGDGLDRATALCRAGYPIPLVQAQIVGDDMQVLPWDDKVQGELVLRAPWLTASYCGDLEASQSLWRGGWLHTQDIASIDSNGAVTIRDRIKDVIKSGGEWVSSTQLEELILQHPGVRDVAVVGVADQKWGERPVAIVVGKNEFIDQSVVKEHLQHFVDAGNLNRIAVPAEILFTESLPKTSVGKTDKKQLRERLNDGISSTDA